MVKQLKIVLGEDLRRKLDEASARSGKSIAEEIRSRVERSFEEQATIERIFAQIDSKFASERERRQAQLETIKREVEHETEAEIKAIDPKTLNLLDFVNRLAKEVERQTGSSWHEHPGVLQVFSTALAIRVRRLGSDGEPIAFEIQAAPLRGKKIITTADRSEHATMLEHVDSWAHANLIEKTSPQIHDVMPTEDELPGPPQQKKP